MTNDSPFSEPPNEIIADMVAGYPDSILRRNAAVPYQPGFLQDPGRVEFTALEFLWQNCYECALNTQQTINKGLIIGHLPKELDTCLLWVQRLP